MNCHFFFRSVFSIVFSLNSYFVIAQDISERSKTLPIPYLNNELNFFGSSVSIDGQYAVVGSPSQSEADPYATVFEIQTDGQWKRVARLTPSDGNRDSYFGCSVSIFEETIVVGAWGDEKHGSRRGRVFVFSKPDNGWIDMNENAVLRSSNNADFDYFGYSVSVYENTIVVGKLHNYAYIFEKPGSSWTDMYETAILRPRPGTSNNYFGSNVAIYENTVVVGAKQDDAFQTNSGSAYVYQKPYGGWIDMEPTAKLNASDEDEYDEFGYSVSITQNSIAVGSPRCRGNNHNSGAVYIFNKEGGNWIDMNESAKVNDPEGSMWDYFGSSVYITNQRLIIGATGVDDKGAIFVLDNPSLYFSNDPIVDVEKIQPENLDDGEDYGISVAYSENFVLAGAHRDHSNGFLSGTSFITKLGESELVYQQLYPAYNLNNFRNSYGGSIAIDGYYAVVGSPGYDGGKGAAMVYFIDNDKWVKLAKLTASDAKYEDKFGTSVDIFENTIVVGSTLAKNGTDYQYGSAYVYEMPTHGWEDMTESAKLTANQQKSSQRFGFDVAISDDVVAVGAYEHDSGSENDGAVYIYQKPELGWSDMTETVLLRPGYNPLDCWYFGHAVDIYENTVVIGAHRNRNGYSGCVYIYERPSGMEWNNIQQKAMLRPPNNYSGGEFGFDVSIYKNSVLVGAVDDGGGGASYLFTRPMDGWSDLNTATKLYSTDNLSGGDFGHSVKLYDTIAVVAAPFNNSEVEGTGAIYLFRKGGANWSEGTEQIKFIASDRQRYDCLGYGGVDYSNGYIVAGAPFDDDHGVGSGSAYLFVDGAKEAEIYLHSEEIPESLRNKNSFIKPSVFDPLGNLKFTFELTPELPDNDLFTVLNDTLVPVNGFDFELKNHYLINLEAKANNGLVISNTFEINVKDIAPLVQDSSFFFNENYLNGLILNNHYNLGDTSSVTYNLVSDGNDVFSLDESGNIFLEKQELFDYEKNEEFVVEVEARDVATISTGNLSINLNDVAPELITGKTEVSEDLGSGEEIISFSIEGDTSSISTEIQYTNAKTDAFEIGNEHTIFTRINNVFDFESQKTVSIGILTTDGLNASTGECLINVLDVGPILEDTSFQVKSNITTDHFIGQLSLAGDETSILFEIVSGNDSGIFSLNPDNGELYVANADLLKSERQDQYDLLVKASDGLNDDSASIKVTIDHITGFGAFRIVNELKIYPNPCLSILNIETSMKISHFHITNLVGKLIESGETRTNSIDVAHLDKGIYILHIYSEGTAFTQSFVKE